MANTKVPLASARRLCLYKRFLERLDLLGKPSTSSREIGRQTGVLPYQVRKDINCLGEVGIVGSGYIVETLHERIVGHLGLDRPKKCVVVGVGALGAGVLSYFAESQQHHDIIAGFDVSSARIGTPISGVDVLPLSELRATVSGKGVEIGMIATPAAEAQQTADLLVEAGVKGLLNFTPIAIAAPDGVATRDIDLFVEAETLSYLSSAL